MLLRSMAWLRAGRSAKQKRNSPCLSADALLPKFSLHMVYRMVFIQKNVKDPGTTFCCRRIYGKCDVLFPANLNTFQRISLQGPSHQSRNLSWQGSSDCPLYARQWFPVSFVQK